jgi:RNA-directed DNA polymerase
MATLPIRRHVKIRGKANPYDPHEARYFSERRGRQGRAALVPSWLTL